MIVLFTSDAKSKERLDVEIADLPTQEEQAHARSSTIGGSQPFDCEGAFRVTSNG
jgi:hypothetical protein